MHLKCRASENYKGEFILNPEARPTSIQIEHDEKNLIWMWNSYTFIYLRAIHQKLI